MPSLNLYLKEQYTNNKFRTFTSFLDKHVIPVTCHIWSS